MNVSVGEEASAGTTNSTQIVMSQYDSNKTLTHCIKVTSGSIKFGKGDPVSDAYAFPANDKIVITCKNGSLYCKQASSGDKFVITIIF